MGKKPTPRTPSRKIQIEINFVTLPKEENHERIERLTRKILRIAEHMEGDSSEPGSNPAQGSTHASEGIEDLLASDFERKLGI